MATKATKRDPNNPADWPVDIYPYVVRRKYADPKYFKGHKEAITYVTKLVKSFEADFKMFDRDVPKTCEKAYRMIAGIGLDGGHVNVLLVPYQNVWFDAEIVRRK